MNAQERQDKIRIFLLNREVITVPELCEAFQCSEATIRNDLRRLEGQKLLKRIPGGAVSVGNTPYNLGHEPRTTSNHEAKINLTRIAFEKYVEPNSTIILDAGTTTLALAQHIAQSDIPIRVITNDINIGVTLVKSQNVSLFMCGGICDSRLEAFLDDSVVENIRGFQVQRCFMGVNGIDENGVSITFPNEYRVKQAMCDVSKETIVLADHSKIGQTSFKYIYPLDRINVLITDYQEKVQPYINQIQRRGVQVEIAHKF